MKWSSIALLVVALNLLLLCSLSCGNQVAIGQAVKPADKIIIIIDAKSHQIEHVNGGSPEDCRGQTPMECFQKANPDQKFTDNEWTYSMMEFEHGSEPCYDVIYDGTGNVFFIEVPCPPSP